MSNCLIVLARFLVLINNIDIFYICVCSTHISNSIFLLFINILEGETGLAQLPEGGVEVNVEIDI